MSQVKLRMRTTTSYEVVVEGLIEGEPTEIRVSASSEAQALTMLAAYQIWIDQGASFQQIADRLGVRSFV